MRSPLDIAEFLSELDRSIPFGGAEAWDPVGLSIGDPAATVGSSAVCHEVTEAVIGALDGSEVDTLVSYHPLLFEPTTTLIDGPTPEGRAVRLVRSGVALIVVHTAFDAVRPGTGDALAGALDLDVVGSFGAADGAPIGRLTEADRALSADELAEIVGTSLSVPVKVAEGGRRIRRIALVPGSGASLIGDAIGLADALVTGDVGHHRASAAADAGLTIVDAGHAATERPGIEALYSVVRGIVDDAVLLHEDPNPWKD